MSGEATHSENLLAKWHRRCEESQYGHYTAELVFNKLNYLLGIPVVCLSALAGTSAFASLQADTTSEVIQIATGLVSMAAAILASLQTFLRFSEQRGKAPNGGGARCLEASYRANESEDLCNRRRNRRIHKQQ